MSDHLTKEVPVEMRAITIDDYKTPTLQPMFIDTPALKHNYVLLRVRAAAVTTRDIRLIRTFIPFTTRFLHTSGVGVSGGKGPMIPGYDVSGVVHAVGESVTQFKVGDEVFGDLSSLGYGCGAFAEYVAVPEFSVVHKPSNVPFQNAAVSSSSALAALHAIRTAEVFGKRVLITGASSSVGTFVIQFAKFFQAKEICVLCHHKRKSEVFRKLGATEIIDAHAHDDIFDDDVLPKVDVVIDVSARHSPVSYAKILRYRNCNASSPSRADPPKILIVDCPTHKYLQMAVLARLVAVTKHADVHVQQLNASAYQKNDLGFIASLLSKRVIVPYIDRRYTLNQVSEAVNYIESRKATGSLVILL